MKYMPIRSPRYRDRGAFDHLTLLNGGKLEFLLGQLLALPYPLPQEDGGAITIVEYFNVIIMNVLQNFIITKYMEPI